MPPRQSSRTKKDVLRPQNNPSLRGEEQVIESRSRKTQPLSSSHLHPLGTSRSSKTGTKLLRRIPLQGSLIGRFHLLSRESSFTINNKKRRRWSSDPYNEGVRSPKESTPVSVERDGTERSLFKGELHPATEINRPAS